MAEIDTMELCREDGTPIRITSAAICLCTEPVILRRENSGKYFIAYTRQSTPDTSWDRTVASATPNTPIPKEITNSRSSATFIRLVKISAYSGITELPTARRHAAMVL